MSRPAPRLNLTEYGRQQQANRLAALENERRKVSGIIPVRMPTYQQLATASVPPVPPPQYTATPASVPFSPAPAQYAPPPTSFTPAPVQQTYV